MLIYRISSVQIVRIPSPKKIWMIFAMGETPSLGWSNPRLVEDKEDEGLAVFSFEADPPGEAAADVISPIVASAAYRPREGIRGIKLVSETNAVVRVAQIQRALADGDEDHDFLPYESDLYDQPYEPEELEEYNRAFDRMDAELLAARKCDEHKLLRVPVRVEFKTRGFKLYRRTRYSVTFLEYCYPTDLGDEAESVVRRCLPVAVAAAVAAFPGGPAAALAAFGAALKGCAGAELAGKVSIRIRSKEETGRWHRV